MPQPAQIPAQARRVRLDGTLPAARAIELVAADRAPVVLVGDWAATTAIVASEPLTTAHPGSSPALHLDRLPATQQADEQPASVGGGWIGLIGYGAAARLLDDTLAHPPLRERLPASALSFYDHVLVRDGDGVWWFEQLWTTERAEQLRDRQDLLAERLRAAAQRPAPGLPDHATAGWRSEPSAAGHADAVQACRRRIAAGDLYQANLALRLRARLQCSPALLFSAGVEALAPERGAYIAGGWGAIASFSPELLVSRNGRALITEPIKGTRPRSSSPEEDESLRAELDASEKDRAENVMIVDLMRNDLGRVCRPGSVVADPLCQIRPLAGVWHMVSSVRGELSERRGDGDIAAAMLPAGSVTGAPKQAALATIAELESCARQAFCGSIALASPIGGLELSVIIRTLECSGESVWIDVGGGVTAASDPDAEAAECIIKATPVLRAIGVDQDDIERLRSGTGTSRLTAGMPPRLSGHPLPRPDPRAGVRATLRAEDGRASHVNEHLQRLESSARLLYGTTLPDDLRRRVRDVAAATLDPQRISISVTPAGQADVTAITISAADDPVRLTPVCVPGGIGAHKWTDRRMLVALESEFAPYEPLLCDLDGVVLEASRWAISAELDGQLLTPPADGRILPSLGVALLHEAIRPEPQVLALDDLARASAVYVINAVRGMVPVAEIEGVRQLSES